MWKPPACRQRKRRGWENQGGCRGAGSRKRRRGWETWKWQADRDRQQLGSRSRLGDKESLKIYCMCMDRKKERVYWEQRGRCVRTVNLQWCHISGCFCILIAISVAAAFWPPATFSPLPFLPPTPPLWARIRPLVWLGRVLFSCMGWSGFPKPAVIYALLSGASSEPWEAERSCKRRVLAPCARTLGHS